MSRILEGWGKPKGAMRWHYFDADRKSLCGSYKSFGGVLLQGDNIHPGNCKTCEKRLERMRKNDK